MKSRKDMILALKCCMTGGVWCDKCPYSGVGDESCSKQLQKDIFRELGYSALNYHWAYEDFEIRKMVTNCKNSRTMHTFALVEWNEEHSSFTALASFVIAGKQINTILTPEFFERVKGQDLGLVMEKLKEAHEALYTYYVGMGYVK